VALTLCAECGDRISDLHDACPKCGCMNTGETELPSDATKDAQTSGVDPTQATWRDIAPVLWVVGCIAVVWFLLGLYRASALTG